MASVELSGYQKALLDNIVSNMSAFENRYPQDNVIIDGAQQVRDLIVRLYRSHLDD